MVGRAGMRRLRNGTVRLLPLLSVEWFTDSQVRSVSHDKRGILCSFLVTAWWKNHSRCGSMTNDKLEDVRLKRCQP